MKKFFYNQLQAMALAVAGPSFGKLLVVMPSTDPNYDRMGQILNDVDNNGEVRIFNTLEAAYAAATTNANDVILLSAHSTHTVANGIAWSKNRIHVVGMDGGNRLVQQGAKVQSTDEAADAYVIKVTGVRNSFKNIKFIQVDTNAAALTVAQFGGEGTLCENCSFVFGVADNLDLTTAHEVVMGEDSGTFISCTFGADTLLTSADRSVMDIDQVTSSQECKSNIFKDCVWMISTSETLANLVRVRAAGDILFTNLFIRPIFMASVDSAGGVAVTDAFESIAGITKGTLNLYQPGTFNCTNTCTTATAVQIVVSAVSNNGHEGITPA
jgi:hypothetical protein